MWKHESHFGQTFDLFLGVKNFDFMGIDWRPLAVLQASPQKIPAGLLGNLSVFQEAFSDLEARHFALCNLSLKFSASCPESLLFK